MEQTNINALLNESPIKEWRLEAGLSQNKLAELSGVSLMTVIRNEQGLYPEPSAKIIQVLIDAAVGPSSATYTNGSWKEYERAYHLYQMNVRELTDWGAVDLHYLPRGQEHPFLYWREALGFESRLAFCRAACVSSPQVLNYELARQRTMPKSIRAALGTFINTGPLEKLGKEYYDSRSS